MKSKLPIKTDLFRFITLRTPDHLTQAGRARAFLFHPDISKSHVRECPVARGGGDVTPAQWQTFLQGFQALDSYQAVRAMHPELYDFADGFLRGEVLRQLDPDAAKKLQLDDNNVIALFDQLFFQLLTGRSHYVRQACVQMLLAHNGLVQGRYKDEEGRRLAQSALIVIPRQVLDCLRASRGKDCAGTPSGVHNLGIADFRRVEQTVCCYVPGEVSHIENILAREYKERHTRNLTRTEVSTEITSEIETEKLSDVTTATRNEVSSQVASVLSDSQSSNYGGSLGVSAEFFGAQINANAFVNFSNSQSSSLSNADAQLYAQEVTRRAVERLVQRTTEKRTSRVIKEFEENNRHGFDNRNGDQHVTGIYRWVDIVYTNRLVNYGKRLMFEFLVPEPANFWKRVQALSPKPATGGGPSPAVPVKPQTLSELEINSFQAITRDNYAELGTAYGISLPQPPAETVSVSQAFSPTPPLQHNSTAWTQTFQIAVPTDYEAAQVSGTFNFEYKAWGLAPDAYFSYNIGGLTGGRANLRSSSRRSESGTITGNLNPRTTVQLPVTFQGRQLYTYGVNLTVGCVLTAAKWAAWQAEVHGLLQQAYQNLQSQYEAELSQLQADAEATTAAQAESGALDSQMKRIIEQRELKRACIELVTRPFCRPLGKRLYLDQGGCEDYTVPMIQAGPAYDDYGTQVRFLEQAFDWSVMSYLFYPYYWADRCDWADLMRAQDDDPIHQAFQQAGMARVVVPVRPEYAAAVNLYIETGDIWLGGGLVPETEGDHALSVALDLQTVESVVEGEWESRVPTTLAIVQDKSARLDQEGLPCCDGVETAEQTSSINPASNVLQIIQP